MYLGVKAVKPKDNYLLLLTFENDEQRLFDMKPYYASNNRSRTVFFSGRIPNSVQWLFLTL